ncbi:hypothetical protein C2845_PM18G11940 [Panicum miliaceum]|uniref:Uncharacterized protein n=1 Tax=Panicum miliaceum TaxID=4540 RepID=A0A3L6PK47_PANMI|nr:hypothetical protein C2845_PM18G11940 [Panicum miliaceum]
MRASVHSHVSFAVDAEFLSPPTREPGAHAVAPRDEAGTVKRRAGLTAIRSFVVPIAATTTAGRPKDAAVQMETTTTMWFLASPVCACQVLDALPAWGQIFFLVEG